MAKYRLLDGSHSEGGVLYKKGDVFETAHNLKAMFPAAFERKFEEVHESVETNGGVEEDLKTSLVQKATEEEAAEGLGHDVSDKFPDAEKAGLQVYKNDRKYFLVEEGKTEPLGVPYTSKAAVEEAISEFLK